MASHFFLAKLFLILALCPSLVNTGLVSRVAAPLHYVLKDKFDFEYDDARALDIKAEDFWQPVLRASQENPDHYALFKDAAAVVAQLPENNSYIRDAIQSAVSNLQHADETLTAQASENLQLATEKLAHSASGWGGDLSIWTGPEKWLSLAMMLGRRMIGLGYKERLHEQIEQRRAEILPSLRGAGRATHNVLAETREASNKAFDILKYDIYNQDVPKTPDAARRLANRIVEAARETRHGFLEPVMSSVDGLARDVQGENDLPSATVDQALASGVEAEGESIIHATHLTSTEV